MRILFHSSYTKSYLKRIAHNPKLAQKVLQKIALFQKNSQDMLLKDHALIGSKSDLRSFWITGDIRIIYRSQANSVVFIDIGTHNQVY